MQKQLIISFAHLFVQKVWHEKLPLNYTQPTKFVQLKKNDIQFLTDDQTKLNLQNFQKCELIKQILDDFEQGVFVKVCNRTAKDLSILMNHIKTIEQLITVIKMSEYLTEGLVQQLQGLQNQNRNSQNVFLSLRKYSKTLQKQQNQFRIYILKEVFVGICQKITNKISNQPSELQIQKAKKLGQVVANLIKKQIQDISLMEKHIQISFVVDAYLSEKGKVKVLSIQPYHMHSLSLFQLQQLNSHHCKIIQTKQKPLVKCVSSEAQLKQVDLSNYKMGNELAHTQAFQEWKTFINNS